MIAVRDLRREFEDGGSLTRALNGVSLEIKKGEFVAIMGPSGSGKSTLLHILGFLDRPSRGSYAFLGKKVENLDDAELARLRNREVGFVFQAFHLLGRATVYENVELPLLYSDRVSSERRTLVEQAVASVGLKDKLVTEAGKLSGGEKQRVAIARALVNDPSVIFADEPTGNLDSASGGQVMETLNRLHEQGRTIILVTHETYTSEFAKRLIHLKDGRLESDQPIRNQTNEFKK